MLQLYYLYLPLDIGWLLLIEQANHLFCHHEAIQRSLNSDFPLTLSFASLVNRKCHPPLRLSICG